MSDGITLYMPKGRSVRLIECSPPSWMIRLALLEKELPHEVVELSFAKGEHKTPAMLARNPRGTIPVLTDGDVSMYETYAIFAYLEYAYPSPLARPLMPKERDAHVKAILRLHESSNLKAAGMALFAYLMHTPEQDHDPDALQQMKEALHRELAFWEGYYQGTAWVAGETLSYADLSVFTYVATSAHLGLALETYPSLEAFVERMKTRPSVQRTWPEAWASSRYAFLAPGDHVPTETP